MSSDSHQRDTGSGSNSRPRFAPEFAQRQRRKAMWAGLLGAGMSLVILVESVNAMRTGQTISLGRVGAEVLMPGWAGALIALFLLFLSGWILWRFARKGD